MARDTFTLAMDNPITSNGQEVPDPAAEIAAEGLIANDPARMAVIDYEHKLATAERYGSSNPGPVRDGQHAQLLQEQTAAETEAAAMRNFELPADSPAHRDYLTPQPERLGSGEDRQRTRARLNALNAPRELGGLAPYATADGAPPGAQIGGELGIDFTEQELDAYAEQGRDPVAEAAEQIRDGQARDAARAADVARREVEWQAKIHQREADQQAAWDRQAHNAIDAARAGGADESWIRFHLSMGTLPGHPRTPRA